MSNVLVIHPDDRSTDFLKRIYRGKGWDVINEKFANKEKVTEEIKKHDWVIMMGHGTPSGLFYTPINYDLLDLLNTKKTTSIWCYSDRFFRGNNMFKLKGDELHTGMVISEVAEARMMLGYSPFSKEEMLENMNKYADVIHDCIEMEPNERTKYFMEHYIGTDSVSQFNRKTFLTI